jgi:aspartate/methionine/tyrosine aminotransferase
VDLIKPETKLLVVNFPHNPTGHLPSQEDFETILEIARTHGIYLLSDEMYRFLEIVDGTRLPAACTQYGKAITLSGLSKAFGMPGLRIGWLATQDTELLEKVTLLKDYTTICSSGPSEVLAIMGLRSKAEVLKEQQRRVRRNLDTLADFMAARQDLFAWNRPGGGSICFPRMLKTADTAAYCEKLVENSGIMLVPSSQFQFGSHHIRIGFGREDFPGVLEKFGVYPDQN